MELPVPLITLLVAALAAFVFGFLVHGPVFGKVWMSLMQITPEAMEQGKKDMQKTMPLYLLAAYLQQLVMAFVIGYFVVLAQASDITSALSLAFWIWLGFIATVLLNGVLWEKRTVPLYGFNLAYHLGNVAIMTVILTLWR